VRTTLDIEKDVLFAVKDLARRHKKTAGEVISDLARQSLTRAPAGTEAREPKAFYGFRPLPRRGGVVSNELVNKLREDDVY
jgi:hypothetical protein